MATLDSDSNLDSADTDDAITTPERAEASVDGTDNIADDNDAIDDSVAVGGGTEQDDASGAQDTDDVAANDTDAIETGIADTDTTDSDITDTDAADDSTLIVADSDDSDAADSDADSDSAELDSSEQDDASAEDADDSVDDDMPLVADEPSDDEPSNADSTPSVAQGQAVAARDVEIAELPFLVTAPPAPEDDNLGETEDGLDLVRPRGGLRVTVNPFSPLVLAPPETTATATTPSPSITPGVVNVPIPNEPTTRLGTTGNFPSVGPGSVSAGINSGNGTSQNAPDLSELTTPVPRPLTPQPLQASNLPRPLPGGTLSSTPDILRTSRTGPAAPANPLGATSLSDVAALRIPGQSGSAVDFSEAPAPALGGNAGSAEPAPLPVGSRRATGGPPSAGAPLVAGTSDLSNYLRDNNFQFTGSVIGPVGVGVFRSSLAAAPVTVVLGQALQDTDIVLTSLQGKQAEFTQNDEKQILTLDLR